MNPYSKMAQTAISAISLLAQEAANATPAKLNSADIAEKRRLPKPMIAKVLTILSQAGLVKGSPGPGGGYWLAKQPHEIPLYEIISLFDRSERNDSCPFGPDHCGQGPQCPLHDELIHLRSEVKRFLEQTTLAAFLPTNIQTSGSSKKKRKEGAHPRPKSRSTVTRSIAAKT
jgi:Rrf2 family protein